MPADISRDTYAAEDRRDTRGGLESIASGVSWGAIIAGSVAAASISIILLFLGAGLGLTAVSPWGNHHDGTAKALGIGVIIWSFILQIVAFGVGGYLAGRLRTKWAVLHRDESYFRDTAHGFLAWALGSLVAFCVLSSTVGHLARGVGAVAGHGVSAVGEGAMGAGALGGGAMVMNGNPASAGQSSQMTLDYFIDAMLRPNAANGAANAVPPANSQASTGQASTSQATGDQSAMSGNGGQQQPARPLDPQSRAEVSRILVTSIANGSIAQPDKDYLAQVVAGRTGLSQPDAAKRVDDIYGQIQAGLQKAEDKARQYADDARKAAIGLTLWSFAAMLAGAFAAAIAGTLGGRARDTY